MGRVSRRGFLLGGIALAGGGLLAGGSDLDPAWAVDGPTIVSCDGWGARPNRGVLPVYNRRPVKILVHHTATPNAAATGRTPPSALARSIQKFHMDHRGLARHRPALHGEPRRHRARGAAPQPGVRPRGAVAGRGRALHGPERRRARHRERGHVQRGQPAASCGTSCGRCARTCAPSTASAPARSTRTVANPLSHFHPLRRWVDVGPAAGRRLDFAFAMKEGAAVARLGAVVVGLGLAALVVAYLFFGWPVLLIGVPAFVGVALVVAAVVVSEMPRRKLEEHRATRFDPVRAAARRPDERLLRDAQAAPDGASGPDRLNRGPAIPG